MDVIHLEKKICISEFLKCYYFFFFYKIYKLDEIVQD